MEDWQLELRQAITTADQLAAHFAVDVAALRPVIERYPLSITPHYLRLIKAPGDPIWRQCVPDPAELIDDGAPLDPLAEAEHAPVPGIIHRYPDRALLLVSGSCGVYCRFCTRKRQVGTRAMSYTFGELDNAIAYIARTPAIKDVILSGGDPLLLPDLLLKQLLDKLRRIEHVEIIRLATRLPVTLPSRITERLCTLLQNYPPLYLLTHFNHPRELNAATIAACNQIADAGVVLGNQTVLLKGVNDDPTVLAELFRGLLKIRVKPYYLHHVDLARGVGHFRTPLETGISILRTLRGTLSGLAIPHYVVDLPGGKGKLPITPEAYERSADGCIRLLTPDGETLCFAEDARLSKDGQIFHHEAHEKNA
ncbi:MAG: KamA family radical SAM protein [Desulfuromonadaceae bacterium]|nr:KamA family radical SAM protein [Desulfuromonadaceae bacterium]